MFGTLTAAIMVALSAYVASVHTTNKTYIDFLNSTGLYYIMVAHNMLMLIGIAMYICVYMYMEWMHSSMECVYIYV